MSVSQADIDLLEAARKTLVRLGARGIANPLEDLIEQFLEAARNNPECFKCREPITEFSEVRVVTVRINGEPRDVWVHGLN